MTESRYVQPSISLDATELGTAEHRRVTDVLASGRLSDGPQVDAFAEEFATACGTARAIPTANGTGAVHAGLAALGVGEDDAVVTPALTATATVNAIRQVGATPVLVDVDADTYTIEPAAVEEVLDARDDVAAIVAVHLFGLPAAMRSLSALANEHDVALLEDARHALGGSYRCDPVGSLGDVACFSFNPSGNLTTGEGGAVVTDRSDVARAVDRYVDQGRTADGEQAVVGHNFRMSELTAALGRAQLQRLDDAIEARREHAARFDAAMDQSNLSPPTVPMGRRHAYNRYPIRCPDRERFRAHLRRYGVETAVDCATPVHRRPAHEGVPANAPTADAVAEELVSVPVHPNLTEEDVRAVCVALAEWPS